MFIADRRKRLNEDSYQKHPDNNFIFNLADDCEVGEGGNLWLLRLNLDLIIAIVTTFIYTHIFLHLHIYLQSYHFQTNIEMLHQFHYHARMHISKWVVELKSVAMVINLTHICLYRYLFHLLRIITLILSPFECSTTSCCFIYRIASYRFASLVAYKRLHSFLCITYKHGFWEMRKK